MIPALSLALFLALAVGVLPGVGRADVLKSEIRVATDVLYDSNVLRLPDDAVVQAGKSRADIRHTTSLAGTATVSFGFQQIFFDGGVGRVRYRENGALDNATVNGEGGWRWKMGYPCDGQTTLGYREQQSEIGDILESVANSQKITTVNQFTRCKIGHGLTAGMNTGLRRLGNSRRTASDRNDYSFGSTLSYETPAASIIRADFLATQRSYPRRLNTDGSEGVSSRQTDMGLGLEYRLTPKITFTGRAGLSVVTGALVANPLLPPRCT